MNYSKTIWYQSILNRVLKAENRVMRSEEYLEAERQWARANEELLMLVPEDKREYARKLTYQMDEINLLKYNLLLEETICAVEFDDFDI